jgi:outer membrane protein assembly factor BamB
VTCFIIIVGFLVILIIPNNLVIGAGNKLEIISSGIYEKGYRYNVQGWVYIHIEGESYERGYQYGYLASAEIVDMINRWSNWGHKEDIMKLFFRKSYDEISETWWKICKSKAEKIFWPQFPDEYKQEIKGIAEGVAARGGTVHGSLVDYKDVLTLNVIEETRQTIKYPGGMGRPLKAVIGKIKNGFGKGLVKESYEPGHCTAFIATGDATIDGRIVMAHSTIFYPNYIPQRANIILDVQPSKGHRFIMTSFPGYIWSSEDFYQNENGIMLMETSMRQGPWKTRGTTPVGVRAREAIQYSDSIDDVIKSMKDGNNGLYPNDWVMGDTKTGEIASLELALHNQAVTRTKNGFLWSCCNPKDDKVRWELVSYFGLGIPGRIFFRNWRPRDVDLKFAELGEKYYGIIDIDIVKTIMSTDPICRRTTDCKVTDSELVEKFGLWVHMGNPDGNLWSPSEELKEELKGIQILPASGWVNLYASRSEPTNFQAFDENDEPEKTSILLWSRPTEYFGYTDASNKLVKTSISKDFDVISNSKEVSVVNKKTGGVKWKNEFDKITSKPAVTEEEVIVGCSSGTVYSLSIDTGNVEWLYSFPGSVHVSEVQDNTIYIGSENKHYAFDLKSKDLLWEYKTEGIITKNSAINKKTVYFGSWDGNLYALKSKTGDLKWKFETGWGIDTTPAVSNNMVFFGSNDNNFYALDEKTGELKWFFNCKSAIHSSPVVYGEYVFFGSDDGRIYALDKTNGDLAWNFAPGYTINNDDVNNYITTPILSDPVVKDGVVYISAKGNVYALDAQTVEEPLEILEEESSIPYVFVILTCLGIALILSSLFIHIHNNKRELIQKMTK